MKATWLAEEIKEAGVSVTKVAFTLTMATGKYWGTETIQNIAELLVGIDEETEKLIRETLATIQREKDAKTEAAGSTEEDKTKAA